ncbi:MAG: hypothetical protein AABX47_07370 [Nanoarchaeota archaeon]
MRKSVIVIAAMAVLALILFAVYNEMKKDPVARVYPNKTMDVQELTKVDIFDMFDKNLLNSSYITVKGVKLGDDAEAVITKLGRPAGYETAEGDILNLRFEDKATNDTEVIVHLEKDVVTRIAVKPGLEDELLNRSKFNFTKETATGAFGKPDRIYDTKFYHIFEYHDKGLELYFKARKLDGYGFVPPN